MGRVPKISRTGPPSVETPPFDGTRCPPLLTGAGRKFRPRRTGRGCAGYTRPRAGPYGAEVPHEQHRTYPPKWGPHFDASSTTAQSAQPSRLGHARAARCSLIGRSAAEGERRPGRAGLAGVPARHALQRVQHRVHADLVRVLLAVRVGQENCGVRARQDVRERLRLLVHVRRARDARLPHHVLQIRQHEVDERLHSTCAVCRTCTCSPSRRVSTPPGAAGDSMAQGPE